VAHDRALREVRTWADTHGVQGRVTCSSGFKSPAGLSRRADFICLVRRSPDDCTVLHVSMVTGVHLLRPHGECTQPL
jgi:hypothetical protein